MAIYTVAISAIEKLITRNKILLLSMLIHLRNETKSEEFKKVLDKIVKEHTGEIRQEVLKIEFTQHDFPLKPILERLIRNGKGDR